MAVTLSSHQKEVGRKIMGHLLTNGQALLSGISGVGKSTLTQQIISEFKSTHSSVWVCGTTHKSVEVIQKLTGHDISRTGTIHSFLNMVPDRTGYNKPMIVNHTAPERRTNLLVIDEYSMLTKDVIDALRAYQACYRDLSVLFVGDASQLILNEDDIKVLDLEKVTEYLTEPQRHGAMSDIAMYSTMVSKFILGKGPEPYIPYGDEIIKYTNHSEFINAWKQSKEKDRVILAYKNQTVKTYNNNIAKLYRNQKSEYEVGNKVILRDSVHTTGGGVIPNRRQVEIANIVDKKDYYVINTDNYGQFKVNKTAAWLNEKTKKYAEHKDWFNFYRIRDQYVQVHHADAMTAHASQGSTFEEVFVDASDMMTAREHVRRMAYVAISRAKTKVHVYVGNKREYGAFKKDPMDEVLMALDDI